MSEEITKNEEKKCNCQVFNAISVIALLLSIAALTMSVLMYSGTIQAAGAQNGPVKISTQYDKGKSLEKALATKKPVIVFFYTDWCGFCQRFIKTYAKVAKDPKIKKNFEIAYVNCEKEENHKIMEEYCVQGFPTVFVIDKEGKKTQLENSTFFNEDSKEVITQNALALIGIGEPAAPAAPQAEAEAPQAEAVNPEAEAAQ